MADIEKRFNDNIKSTIDSSIKEALEVMQASFCTAVQNNPAIQSHSSEINGLKEENFRLNQRVQQLTAEQGRIKRQLTRIESKNLEHSVIVRGILEEYKETEQMIVDKLHSALSPIMQGETEQEKLKNAKEIMFTSCRRLGRFSRNRIRPLSVELQHKQDVEFILDNRFDLKRGIYVDKEYPADVERKRKTLLPVLRAAKLLGDYKKQSRLEDDKIVLKGRAYTVNTLNQLPEELNAFKVTSRENETTVGFFGEINQLSNFYPSPFLYNGVRYVSSEQFIQSNKAKYFGDHDAYNQILGCSTSLECKTISQQIRNVNE